LESEKLAEQWPLKARQKARRAPKLDLVTNALQNLERDPLVQAYIFLLRACARECGAPIDHLFDDQQVKS